MTLLKAQYSVDSYTQSAIPEALLELLVKTRLLHVVAKDLSEREDLLEVKHRRETTYRLKLHVFSEAELIDYRNSVINEFMATSGMFSAMRSQQQQEDN